SLLLLADPHKPVENDGDKAAEEDCVTEGAGGELDGADVETVGGDGVADPVLLGHVAKDGIDGAGSGSDEKGREHDAGLAEAAAPCAEKQGDHQAEEDDFGSYRQDFVELLQSHEENRRHQEHRDLNGSGHAAVGFAGEAKNELESDGHEDAANKEAQRNE